MVGFALFMAGCFSSPSSAGWLLPVQQFVAAGFRGWDTHLLIPLKFKRSNNFTKISCKPQLISILLLISFLREMTLAPMPTPALNPFIPALRTLNKYLSPAGKLNYLKSFPLRCSLPSASGVGGAKPSDRAQVRNK